MDRSLARTTPTRSCIPMGCVFAGGPAERMAQPARGAGINRRLSGHVRQWRVEALGLLAGYVGRSHRSGRGCAPGRAGDADPLVGPMILVRSPRNTGRAGILRNRRPL
jgi:hypothetical protein